MFSAKKLCGRLPAGGATSTVRATLMVVVRLPDVPVIVTVAPPVLAEPLTERLSVLAEEVLGGLRLAVTPDGRPEAVRFTVPVKPCKGITFRAIDPLAVCCNVNAFGDAESVNFGGGGELRAALDPPHPKLAIRQKDPTQSREKRT